MVSGTGRRRFFTHLLSLIGGLAGLVHLAYFFISSTANCDNSHFFFVIAIIVSFFTQRIIAIAFEF